MAHLFPYRLRGHLYLFAAVALPYLFSTSRERPWGDATPIWEVADSIVHSHSFHAKTRWPLTLANGKDSNLYGAWSFGRPFSPRRIASQVVR